MKSVLYDVDSWPRKFEVKEIAILDPDPACRAVLIGLRQDMSKVRIIRPVTNPVSRTNRLVPVYG